MEQQTDDVFYEKYTVLDNPFTQDGPYDNKMYETYGDEYEAIKKACDRNPKTVWTIINNNSGWEGICAGWHYIDRVGYMITEEEWESADESYTTYDETEVNDTYDKLSREALEMIFSWNFNDIKEVETIRELWFDEWNNFSLSEKEEFIRIYKNW